MIKNNNLDFNQAGNDIPSPLSVKATVRKAVTWDTNTLWEALNKVEEDFGSEVAKNISDITVKVSENKYKDADPRIQLILEKSRTVEAKGPDYYISVEETS